MKRKPGFTEGKSPITVLMRAELADALATKAREDQRNQSVTLERMVESYLSNKTLPPMPEGVRAHRHMVGGGETKIRRYNVEPKTVRLLKGAEDLGYSQSYVIEEAIKEGITEPVGTEAKRAG